MYTPPPDESVHLARLQGDCDVTGIRTWCGGKRFSVPPTLRVFTYRDESRHRHHFYFNAEISGHAFNSNPLGAVIPDKDVLTN